MMKVGIAGFGVVGKRRKDCVDANPNLQLVAVCDQTFNDDGVFFDVLKYYQDYKKLLTENLDILIVCMTNDHFGKGNRSCSSNMVVLQIAFALFQVASHTNVKHGTNNKSMQHVFHHDAPQPRQEFLLKTVALM